MARAWTYLWDWGALQKDLKSSRNFDWNVTELKNHPVKGIKFIPHRGGAAVSPLSQKPSQAKGAGQPQVG